MLDVRTLFGSSSEHHSKLLRTIARSGVPKILMVLERGPKKFSQLMFEAKLNPGVLDRNLKALMDIRVVKKNDDGCYELTEAGQEIASLLRQLSDILSR